MSQSEEVLTAIRAALAISGGVLVVHEAILLEGAYQTSNPIYSFFSSILVIFVALALVTLGLAKKPEKVFEIIADFLGDVLERIP